MASLVSGFQAQQVLHNRAPIHSYITTVVHLSLDLMATWLVLCLIISNNPVFWKSEFHLCSVCGWLFKDGSSVSSSTLDFWILIKSTNFIRGYEWFFYTPHELCQVGSFEQIIHDLQCCLKARWLKFHIDTHSPHPCNIHNLHLPPTEGIKNTVCSKLHLIIALREIGRGNAPIQPHRRSRLPWQQLNQR